MRIAGDIWRATAAVAAGAALLGFAPIGMRLSELGPQATAFWRFVFALPLVWLLARRAGPIALGGRTPVLFVAGVLFGLDIAFWHAALGLTTVANATLLSNMTPILAAAAGLILFRERIAPAFWLGAPIALAGAGLLSVSRSQSGLGADGVTGDLLAGVSAIWYAGYLIIVARVRQSVAVWPVMLVTTAAAAGLALVATLVMGEQLLPQTVQGWLILVGLGVVVHVGGQGLIALGLGGLPISVSTVLLWVQPLAAAALSWVLFDERLGPLGLLGAALVLGGVYVVQRARG